MSQAETKEIVGDALIKPFESDTVVELFSVGNPDFGQDPSKPMYGCEPNKKVPVSSFKDAAKKCVDFTSRNDLWGGNWNGGNIIDVKSKKNIGYVSYNGRVWTAPY